MNLLVYFLTFFEFYSKVHWNDKIHMMISSFFLLIETKLGFEPLDILSLIKTNSNN